MTCRDCQNQLSQYVDDRLDETRRQQIEAHRAECATCEQAYRLMSRTRAALAAEGPAAVPAGLAERAARAALTAEAPPARSWLSQWIPVAWPTAVAAAAATILLLVSAPPESRPAASATAGDPVSAVMGDTGDVDDFEGEVLAMETTDEN